VELNARGRLLRAALGFLSLSPDEPAQTTPTPWESKLQTRRSRIRSR